VTACEPDRTRLLQDALADARAIHKEGVSWGKGLGNMIEACVAGQRGQLRDCRRLLDAAENAFLASRMDQFVAAVCYRKAGVPGEFLDEGARAAASRRAQNWFTDQNVQDPERLVQMLCPRWTSS